MVGGLTAPISKCHVLPELRGIEIYKDRPIFYGLGEFFRQMDIIGLSGMREQLARSVGPPGAPFPVKYESIVAVSRFDDGKLSEVRLHPIELTYNVRMAQRGLPALGFSRNGAAYSHAATGAFRAAGDGHHNRGRSGGHPAVVSRCT